MRRNTDMETDEMDEQRNKKAFVFLLHPVSLFKSFSSFSSSSPVIFLITSCLSLVLCSSSAHLCSHSIIFFLTLHRGFQSLTHGGGA